MSTAERVARPGTVTTVIVLTWIAAISNFATGVGLLAFANEESFLDAADVAKNTATTWGIVALIVGALAVVAAVLLQKGSNFGRHIVFVVMGLTIVGGVLELFQFGSNQLAEAIISIALGLTVIGLLYNARADEYFKP